MKKILILGGYGNFGSRISTALAKANIAIIIAGRNRNKAESLAQNLSKTYPNCSVEIATFDVKSDLANQLQKLNPTVLINTAGPFQNSDYSVAETCIQYSINYIDLADGRDFVGAISTLNEKAKAKNVLVVSGASTVPALSSAVLEKYKNEFSEIDSLTFGISPGQKAHRGLATTKGILTYLGKPLKPCSGSEKTRYGWQDLYKINYPELGARWMANCDIPDLDILPSRYKIKSIRFSAGMESALLHFSIWLLSFVVRAGLPINLPNHANFLLKASHLFDRFGSADGGMHMVIEGKDQNQKAKTIKWFIIAKNGDGPQIPTIPAIILAKKIINGQMSLSGAMPCVAMVSLEEYLDELREFEVSQHW